MKEKIDIDGIENVDQLKDTYGKLVEQYEEAIKSAGPLAKKAIQLGYKAQIDKINKKYDKIKESIAATKSDIGEIGKQGLANEMGVAHDVYSEKQKVEKWQDEHKDRSSGVTKTVGAIQKGENSAKSMLALGAIKLTTIGAKGARLFGAKETAKKMSERGSKYAEALFTKDSKIGSFAEKMAESGFVKADQVRNTIAHSKEMVEAYGRAGIQTGKDAINTVATTAYVHTDDAIKGAKRTVGKVKDAGKTAVTAVYVHTDDAIKGAKKTVKDAADTVVTSAYVHGTDAVETVKNGALAVGKAVVVPIAAIGAVGSLSLKAVEKGAKEVGERVEKKTAEIKEDISNYKDIATAKTQSVKNNMKVGFFSKVSKFLENVKNNVDNSLEVSKTNQKSSDEKLVAAKTKITSQKEAQEQDNYGR